MTVLLPIILAASTVGGGCHAVDSGSVLAQDIVAYVPELAGLNPDFLLGYVQDSGAPRVFSGADLARLARNRGVELPNVSDVCFYRRTFLPRPEEIRDAMLKSIAMPDTEIEILSAPQHPVPSGSLVFPRSGVQGTGREVTWQGFVQAREGLKFPISVRARISSKRVCLIAAADLIPRRPIQPGDLAAEPCQDSPFDETAIRDAKDAVGLLAKTRIPKGMTLRKSSIERPLDVGAGDMVRVDVFMGATHLSLQARADTAGMKGSTVTVRNLSTGQTFRGEVTGKDHVSVGGPIE
jgi:flagella basal body P-ring formation protein FlgA